jgi:uncharacterized protein YbjT (DUF2867 family)
LVGGHALAQALADERFCLVVAPTRRKLPPHDRLLNPIIDFDRLPRDAKWWTVDSFICTLGTTRARAGSNSAFKVVGYGYPLAIASLARQHGASSAAICSAQGANARSSLLYFRTKGELDEAIAALGFPSLTIARPGLIGGRQAPGRGEKVARTLLSTLGPVLPRRLRINPAATIAHTLLEAVHRKAEGRHVITADQLTGAG